LNKLENIRIEGVSDNQMDPDQVAAHVVTPLALVGEYVYTEYIKVRSAYLWNPSSVPIGDLGLAHETVHGVLYGMRKSPEVQQLLRELMGKQIAPLGNEPGAIVTEDNALLTLSEQIAYYTAAQFSYRTQAILEMKDLAAQAAATGMGPQEYASRVGALENKYNALRGVGELAYVTHVPGIGRAPEISEAAKKFADNTFFGGELDFRSIPGVRDELERHPVKYE
jgi:hypothetical protein